VAGEEHPAASVSVTQGVTDVNRTPPRIGPDETTDEAGLRRGKVMLIERPKRRLPNTAPKTPKAGLNPCVVL